MNAIEVMLIVLPSIVGIIGIIISNSDNKYKKLLCGLSIFLLIVITGFNLYYSWQESEHAKYESNYGTINSNIEYPTVVIGSVGYTNIGESINLMSLIGMPDPLKVVIVDEGVKVSTVLRNEDGEIIAKIVDNNWQVTPTSLDKNFDESALEIIDDDDNVVFQISENDNKVYVYGIFYDEKGDVILVNKNGIQSRHTISIDEKKSIAPIFKYPSSAYPGVRI